MKQNLYVIFYNGRRGSVKASGLYEAKQKAVKLFGVTKKNEHMVSVVLAEKDGVPATYTPDF